MKFLFFLFFLMKLIACLKREDYCYQKKIYNKPNICQETHNYTCWDGFCSVDRGTCENLQVFTLINNYERKNYFKYRNKYKIFMRLIKFCPEPPKYKWNSNDFCLNSKDCLNPPTHRLFSSLISKLNECKCVGKYIYRCNADYCGVNKLACDGLKKNRNDIKKCKA